MSSVAEQFDMKSHTIQWLNTLSTFYVKDLKALPDNQLTASPGGCCRTPQEFTGEIIGMCKYAIACIREEELPEGTEEEMRKSMAALTTGEQLGAAVEAVTKEFSDAIAGANPEIWGKEIMPPWKMPISVWGLTNMAVNHFWYHDGQLNTYQCLLGDEKMHWMD